jgi:hypothetical protein
MARSRLFHAIVIAGCALAAPWACGPEENRDPTPATLGGGGGGGHHAHVDSGHDAGQQADLDAGHDAGAHDADAGVDAGARPDGGHEEDGGWHPTK